ncbi:MAG: metal ABC transporter permease [Anaerolineae bacterium]|jgi:zinc/manganese transport system permease protein
MASLLAHTLVQNTFLAGTIVAILCGGVGYFVILRGQAFATESLSHVSFTGAMGAAVVGVSLLVGMFFLTLLSTVGTGALSRRLQGRDVEIGMILTFALGLGVLFLSLYSQSATRAAGVLFGTILSVSWQDTLITLGVGIVVLAILPVLAEYSHPFQPSLAFCFPGNHPKGALFPEWLVVERMCIFGWQTLVAHRSPLMFCSSDAST